MRCESSLGWKCCIGLTETVALISNRFNGLAQATPRFNRLAELAACVQLAPMRCGNQLEVAVNIEGAVAERILLSVVLSISCKMPLLYIDAKTLRKSAIGRLRYCATFSAARASIQIEKNR